MYGNLKLVAPAAASYPIAMARTSERRRLDLLDFARRLSLSIAALGYSKAAFARTIDVDRGRLHHWTKGGSYPDPEMLLKMDRMHGLSADWLLSGRMSGLAQDVVKKIQQTASGVDRSQPAE